jgi:hypothetical protein
MEFCGRSHDYFSRVKAAGRNKTLGSLAGPADGSISPSISWAFNGLLLRLGKLDRPLCVNTYVAYRPAMFATCVSYCASLRESSNDATQKPSVIKE